MKIYVIEQWCEDNDGQGGDWISDLDYGVWFDRETAEGVATDLQEITLARLARHTIYLQQPRLTQWEAQKRLYDALVASGDPDPVSSMSTANRYGPHFDPSTPPKVQTEEEALAAIRLSASDEAREYRVAEYQTSDKPKEEN